MILHGCELYLFVAQDFRHSPGPCCMDSSICGVLTSREIILKKILTRFVFFAPYGLAHHSFRVSKD